MRGAVALQRLHSPQERPVRRRRSCPEQAIQKAVFAHIDARGVPGLFAFHPANGGWRSPVEAAILTSLGVRPGIPDIVCIYQGKIWMLELKAPGSKLTAAQIDCARRLRRAGATVGTAAGLDEALAWLANHGLLRGVVQ
jgi:hypothetical protein